MRFVKIRGNAGWGKLTPDQIKEIQLIVCTAVEPIDAFERMEPDLMIGACDAQCGRYIYYRKSTPEGPPKVCNYCITWITNCVGTA